MSVRIHSHAHLYKHLASEHIDPRPDGQLLVGGSELDRSLQMASASFLSFLLPLFLLLLLMPFADARRRGAEIQSSRSPHGLAFENPMPFPPAAFEFFHPDVLLPPASSPMPLASSFYPAATSAKVRADEEVAAAGVASASRAGHGGRAGVAAMALGLALVVLAAIAFSYVVVKRRADVKRGKTIVQPAEAEA